MPSVIFYRHGPAEDRDPRRWPDDDDRPLTREGRGEVRRAARGLARIEPKVESVLSSPALRAHQTAEIVREELEVRRALVLWPELSPGESAAAILARLAGRSAKGRPPVLVGHEPTLGELVGLSIGGEAISWVRLSKGGAACVTFAQRVTPGGAVLDWLLTRRQLMALGR